MNDKKILAKVETKVIHIKEKKPEEKKPEEQKPEEQKPL
jgi:hypothetical protein